MGGDYSLYDLLVELFNQIRAKPKNIEELLESIQMMREKANRLLEKAPLLVMAAAWSKGNCKEIVPYAIPVQYTVDRSCLAELARYLQRFSEAIGRELGCRFRPPLAPGFEDEQPLLLIADALYRLRTSLTYLIEDEDPEMLADIQKKYLMLLIALRAYCTT